MKWPKIKSTPSTITTITRTRWSRRTMSLLRKISMSSVLRRQKKPAPKLLIKKCPLHKRFLMIALRSRCKKMMLKRKRKKLL